MTRAFPIRQKVLTAVAAIVFAHAVPAHAALYFDWSSPLIPNFGAWHSSYAALYNPSDASEFPNQWYEGGWGDTYSDYYPAFTIKSDSGQAGSVPVEIKLTLSGNVTVDEYNATGTEFQTSERLRYGIRSSDGFYNKEFEIQGEFQNQTSYLKTDIFLDYFEIDEPYQMWAELVGFPPTWNGATVIDPDGYGHSIVYDEPHGDIAFNMLHSAPEPATFLLFGAGVLGAFARRRRGTRHH